MCEPRRNQQFDLQCKCNANQMPGSKWLVSIPKCETWNLAKFWQWHIFDFLESTFCSSRFWFIFHAVFSTNWYFFPSLPRTQSSPGWFFWYFQGYKMKTLARNGFVMPNSLKDKLVSRAFCCSDYGLQGNILSSTNIVSHNAPQFWIATY